MSKDAKKTASEIDTLDARSREIFTNLVQTYLDTGGAVGSRTLTRGLSEKISPATVRNVMQDLELLGLLGSPHVSAGRIPTQMGLRLFVDGLLEMQGGGDAERAAIDAAMRSNASENNEQRALLERTGGVLSSLSKGAALVFSKKIESPVRHVDFVALGPDRALVILVTMDGHVENRVFAPPLGMTPDDMRRAANFLNAQVQGKTLSEVSAIIQDVISTRRQEIDGITAQLIDAGLVSLGQGDNPDAQLVVRGRSNLLENDSTGTQLETLQALMDDLEQKRDLAALLGLADDAQPVRVFIGAENKLFSLSGSSLVVSPYMNDDGRIIGAVGVIGPTRLNYARIVPMVSYTAQLVGKLLSSKEN